MYSTVSELFYIRNTCANRQAQVPRHRNMHNKFFITVSNPETTAKITDVRVADGEVEPKPGCIVSLSSPSHFMAKIPFCLVQDSVFLSMQVVYTS